MEDNKTKLLYIMEKVCYFHDSDIENIIISYRTYCETVIENYPKEFTDIQIVICLPLHEDPLFSQKKIKLTFYEVDEFYIQKNINWKPYIVSASDMIENEEFSRFEIDDFISLKYKHFNWELLDDGLGVE